MRESKTAPRKEFEVVADNFLLAYMAEVMPSLSRNKLKSLLSHRQVSVNGTVVTQWDFRLAPGDGVHVLTGKGPEVFRHPMLRIVYEDDAIIVIDKRNGLLSVGTDKERTKTAFYLLSDHVKRSDPRNKVFVIHRLDRETSGLMMFARSLQVQEAMQSDWNEMVRERSYVAVVEGTMPAEEGVIDVPLKENKNYKVYADPGGERAVTRYRVLSGGRDYSLVELQLETGKKNQIRAHLSHIGNPVSGDRKYGAGISPARRVCLHARVLNIIHPVTRENMDFSSFVPPVFEQVVTPGKGQSVAGGRGRGGGKR